MNDSTTDNSLEIITEHLKANTKLLEEFDIDAFLDDEDNWYFEDEWNYTLMCHDLIIELKKVLDFKDTEALTIQLQPIIRQLILDNY